jgi:uncharacterized protein
MSETILDRAELVARLTVFKQQRAEEYRLRALGYFGSYARNEASADSDVDIVFDTDEPNLYRAVVLREELEALLGRPVDVLQLRGLTNPRLRARIEKEAVYV